MKNLQKQMNIIYASLQGFYWMAYCPAMTFASVFLLALGYSNTEVGVVLAVSNILALVLQPVLADIADRSKRINVLHLLWMLLIITAAFFAVTAIVSARSAILSVSYALALAAFVAVQPFMTALSFRIDCWGIHINFGACRSAGSLTYAIMAPALGYLVERYGNSAISFFWFLLLFFFVVFLAVITWRDRNYKEDRTAFIEENDSSGVLGFIIQNKRYSIFLLGAALLMAAHSLLLNFTIVVIRNIGGNSADMGNLNGYMALIEIPAMLFFDSLLTKFRCSTLLKFSTIMFSIEALAVWIAPSVGWMFAAYSFQALSFAVFTPAGVKYALTAVNTKDTVKAQAYLAVTSTLGTVVSSFFGGILFDSVGVSTTMLIGAVISVIGTVVAYFSINPPRPGSACAQAHL